MHENILNGFLDKLAEDAIKQIKEEGRLSKENALPYLIKDQYTRITHIETEFLTRSEFQTFRGEMDDFRYEVSQKFKDVENKIDSVHKLMGLGFGFISMALAVMGLAITYK